MSKQILVAVSVVFLLLIAYYTFLVVDKPLFNEGDKRNYALKFSTHFDKTKNSYQIQDDIALQAVLNFRVFKVEKNFSYLGFELSQVNFELRNTLLKDSLELLYQTMVIIKVSNDGKFLNYYSSKNDKDIQGLLQLYSQLQVVVKVHSTYETEEFDFNSPYTSNYKSDNKHFEKERLYYTAKSAVKIQNSLISMTLDEKASWIKNLELQESLSTSFDGKIVLQNSNKLSLVNRDNNFDESLPLFSENRNVETILKDFSLQKDKSKSQLKVIEKKSLAKSIKDNNITLETLTKKNIISDLDKYLSVNDEDIEKLVDLINTGDDDIDRKYIYVLEKIGSPKAQKFLQDIATSDTQSHINRLRAIISVGAQKSITPSSVETLEQFVRYTEDQELSDTAQLSLGSIASTHPNSFAANIDQNLRATYTQGSSKKIVLLSMQNSGIDKFTDEILHSAQTSTKVSDKVLALELLSDIDQNSEITQYLKETYMQASDDKIKAQALSSLNKSAVQPLILQDIQKTLLDLPQSQTRTQMIKYLAKNIDYDEKNKIILKEALKSERDTQNIKTIIKAIR